MYNERDYYGETPAQAERDWWEAQALRDEEEAAERAALKLFESTDETDAEALPAPAYRVNEYLDTTWLGPPFFGAQLARMTRKRVA